MESITDRLRRNWIWTARPDNSVSAEFDVHIESILTNQNDDLDTENLLFLSVFYLSDESLAPWSAIGYRQRIRDYIDTHQFNYEKLIVGKLEEAADYGKRLKISNNRPALDSKNKPRMIINEKLIGKSFSQGLENVSLFKKDYVYMLGYLNLLISKCNISKNWRLILPILLIFLDDTDVMVKREACILLQKILVINDVVIIQSQTGPLFERSIHPLLLSLPSLTPEEKSIVILPIAYDTLFKLFKVGNTNATDTNGLLRRYTKLGNLLNETVLPSMYKCKDYLDLLNVLIEILSQLMKECERFLKVLARQIIHASMTILVDPQIAFSTTTVLKLMDVLEQCLSTCGERKSKYKYDVLACMAILDRRIPDNLQVQNRIEFFRAMYL